MNITLAFEPTRADFAASADLNIVIINDSDFEIAFWLGATGPGSSACRLIGSDRIAAGEMLYVGRINPTAAESLSKFTLQIIAWRSKTPFESLSPMHIERSVSPLVLGCASSYRPGRYFDSPVLEIPLVEEGEVVEEIKVDPDAIMDSISEASHRALAAKFGCVTRAKKKKKKGDDAANPNKVLPLIEVDLHIHELLDTTTGMTPADMLAMQLEEVEKTMKVHRRRIGQKIVFIHGKGDGVLRREMRNLLRRKYPTAEIQDASYQLYGGGATLVVIHQ